MARNTTPNRRLNGLYPLAYLGDNPTTPSDFYSLTRDPTVNDYQGFYICDMWLNTTTYDCWLLVNLAGSVATWVKFTSGSGGNIEKILTDSGTATPIADQINLFANPKSGKTVLFTASATNVINLSVTDGAGNTTIGVNSGASITTGSVNTGLGQGVLKNTTTGLGNTMVGFGAGNLITTGSTNTGIGNNALRNGATGLLTGSDNIAVGNSAGWNYTGAEASNIIIGNTGTVAESNKIHIGTNGTGAGQQNTTYLHGGTVYATNGSIYGGFDGTTVAGQNQIVAYTNSNNAFFYALGANTFNAGTIGSGLALTHLRGTPTVPLATVTGDELGRLDFVGYDGTNVGAGASIRSVTNGTINTTNHIPSDLEFYTKPNSASSIAQRMIIASTGAVTINAPDSGVAITSIATFGQAVAGTGVPVVVDAAGLFGTVVSSAKFKENIVDMLSHSDLIMKLRPVIFNYIEDKFKNTSVGLIAEEVAEVMPDLAVKNAEGEITTVKYLDLIPMLLNELQKLVKRVEELEKN